VHRLVRPGIGLLCLVVLTSVPVAAGGSELTVVAGPLPSAAPLPQAGTSPPETPAAMLATAQRRFYDGRYLEASDLALALRTADPTSLPSYELRTSALLFQIKRLIGNVKDKDKAFKACGECPALLRQFLAEFKEGQAAARTALAAAPGDLSVRFFLGKLNLNYVWLQLGPLGKRTGWNEYREARRSIEAVLAKDPGHVRARVAHAWIEYIVDTRTPWGFGWILGGGNRKRAVEGLRAAAAADAPFFDKTEAGFALWEMQVSERDFTAAVVSARRLAADFPENRELTRFLDANKGK
jgi:hypothetical protein